MATTVYTVEEVQLQDGTTVTLKPLNIVSLRKFMKVMEEFGAAENEEQSLDIMLKASALCLKKDRPEFWDNEKNTQTEAYEEAIDIPTIYKILDVCGGVNLNDPNLLAAATKALGES